jgi:hypothetical protein
MGAVGRATGGGRSQAMPSLPSGTASSQPPRIQLSEAEIEAVLVCIGLKPQCRFSTILVQISVGLTHSYLRKINH